MANLNVHKNYFRLKGNVFFMLGLFLFGSFLSFMVFEDWRCTCRKVDFGDAMALLISSFCFYQAFYYTQMIEIHNSVVKRSFLYGLIVLDNLHLNDLYCIKIGYSKNRNGEIYSYKLHFMGSITLCFSSHFSQSGELINFIRYHFPQVEFKEPDI